MLALVLAPVAGSWAQTSDSSRTEPTFSTAEAWLYVDEAVHSQQLWKSEDDSLRMELRRLLDHSQEPYDSIRERLNPKDIGQVAVHLGSQRVLGSIRLKWLNDSVFVIDPRGWNRDLYLKKETRLIYPELPLPSAGPDSLAGPASVSDSLASTSAFPDSSLLKADTLIVEVIDTAALRMLGISMHVLGQEGIDPPLSDPQGYREVRLSGNRQAVLYLEPTRPWMADEASPFHQLKNEQQLDSLQHAIRTLMDFTAQRDSIRLIMNDINGRQTAIWLSDGHDDATRFWVRNYNNDSITLWVGNPARNQISLLLEDDVNFSRMSREEIVHLPAFMEVPQRQLSEMRMLEPEPIYWDYEFASVLTMSQTYLQNWTKGGESSFATMMDISGKATYNNKATNSQWINTARLKFGTIMTSEKGFRKNHDQFEIDSKFNRNAWGKIGMSASFYMKNQLAKGYNYPNDSVAVSKFLNPGTITVGLGAEIKPMDKTTINVAPLSYKTTFVLDTALIDQTAHGIDAHKKAKRELGLQVVIDNEFSPYKGMTLTNRARLFSNYLDKPQNIDVDWEVILEQKIAWFFTVRLNLHMIYDDDVKFKVSDDSDKEVPKLQFKEFIGLALSFKF